MNLKTHKLSLTQGNSNHKHILNNINKQVIKVKT